MIREIVQQGLVMTAINLLLVEDEKDIRELITRVLPSHEFHVFEAANTQVAQKLLAGHTIQIVLLDWMLPGKSGIAFLAWLKEQPEYTNIPVIMLTAKAEEENKLKGLNSGADDYITKPFSIDELIARIKAVLRRGAIISLTQQITMGNLILDLAQQHVSIDQQTLALTKIQFQILAFLLQNPDQIFSRAQIIHHIWGSNSDVLDRTVDTQVKRLRKILNPFNYQDLIVTVRGLGYKLNRTKE